MNIYGAGMAGLLAGHYFRRLEPKIYEAQDALPNNHKALLRFRTENVSKSSGIPFKKVMVNKLAAHAGKLYQKPDLKLNNMYAQKVSGKVSGRSISSLEPVERYIAPDNFIELLSKGLSLEFGVPLTKGFLEERYTTIMLGDDVPPVISTIPMNLLMQLVDWPDAPEFKFLPVWSVTGKIVAPAIDVYNTVYYPDYTDDYYRISITGDTVIAEFNKDVTLRDQQWMLTEISHCLAREFGICEVEFAAPLEVKYQKYGKLLPIDEKARKSFILYMTDKFRVYSLGRFATWRQILMDDVILDLAVIERLINDRDDYSKKLISIGA